MRNCFYYITHYIMSDFILMVIAGTLSGVLVELIIKWLDI